MMVAGMSDLIGLTLTAVALVGVLLFMIRGARSRRGAARTLRGFRYYKLDGAWAHAILAALALGQIAAKVSGGGDVLFVVACVVGGVCGWFVEPNGLVHLGLGSIGAVAAVIGSVAFVSEASDPSDLAVRGGMVLALGLLFGMAALLRLQPLAGLTWFAAASIVVFLASPDGVSAAQVGGLSGAFLALVGVGAVVVFALAPQIAIRLGAVAVSVVKVLGPSLGYFPATASNPFPVILATLTTCVLVRLIAARVRR